jgi:hypothetical protein
LYLAVSLHYKNIKKKLPLPGNVAGVGSKIQPNVPLLIELLPAYQALVSGYALTHRSDKKSTLVLVAGPDPVYMSVAGLVTLVP